MLSHRSQIPSSAIESAIFFKNVKSKGELLVIIVSEKPILKCLENCTSNLCVTMFFQSRSLPSESPLMLPYMNEYFKALYAN